MPKGRSRQQTIVQHETRKKEVFQNICGRKRGSPSPLLPYAMNGWIHVRHGKEMTSRVLTRRHYIAQKVSVIRAPYTFLCTTWLKQVLYYTAQKSYRVHAVDQRCAASSRVPRNYFSLVFLHRRCDNEALVPPAKASITSHTRAHRELSVDGGDRVDTQVEAWQTNATRKVGHDGVGRILLGWGTTIV